jgi:hypothetical protein
VTFHISPLPEALLGWTVQNTIWIDPRAQGYGWYADVSAASAAAFTQVGPGSEQQALAGSAAFGHVDLLTVVTHELGHVLGFDSVVASMLAHDWMTATLGLGVRRSADAASPEERRAPVASAGGLVPSLSGATPVPGAAAAWPVPLLGRSGTATAQQDQDAVTRALRGLDTTAAEVGGLISVPALPRPARGGGSGPRTDSVLIFGGNVLLDPAAAAPSVLVSAARAAGPIGVAGSGGDVLLGGSGDDVLIGNAGSDLLVGGFKPTGAVIEGGAVAPGQDGGSPVTDFATLDAAFAEWASWES